MYLKDMPQVTLTEYVSTYTPQLLHPIPRALGREKIAINQVPLPLPLYPSLSLISSLPPISYLLSSFFSSFSTSSFISIPNSICSQGTRLEYTGASSLPSPPTSLLSSHFSLSCLPPLFASLLSTFTSVGTIIRLGHGKRMTRPFLSSILLLSLSLSLSLSPSYSSLLH